MISERKLRTLQPKSRLRKIARLLRRFETDVRDGILPDSNYVGMLIRVAGEIVKLPDDNRIDPAEIRSLNAARHAIMREIGEDPADWDLLPMWRSENQLEPSKRGAGVRRALFLDDIRSPYNVGSLFRTAAAFDISEILLSPESASPDHNRARRTSMGAIGVVPWSTATVEEACSRFETVFALETRGVPMGSFEFPNEGLLIIGNEELGIGETARKSANESRGVVSIELPGPKVTLNVSVAFGILMQSWHARSTTGQ